MYYTLGMQMHHKDIFDRLIVAQSVTEKIALISADSAFEQYGVNLIWK
jgi:PIN domain nuclease of toxin-antitoxin system